MGKDVRVTIHGEQDVTQAANSAADSLGVLGRAAIAMTGGAAAIDVAKEALEKLKEVAQECVQEFAQEEAATMQMTAALATNSSATKDTALSMNSWAEQIEQTTAFTKAQIESQVALLSSLNLNENQMKRMLSAAMNLSSAGYGPLEMMVQGLARAQETGTVGILSRHIPALANFTKAQLEHGAALQWVEQTYPTMTAVMAQSTQGMQAIMTNLVNEQKEKVGAVVASAMEGATRLKGAIETAGTITAVIVDGFLKSGEALVAWFKFSYDAFTGTMALVFNAVATVAKILWSPIEYAFHGTILTIKNAFIDMINFLLAQLTDLMHKSGSLLSQVSGGVLGKGLLGIDLGSIQKIKDEGVKPLGDTIKQLLGELGKQGSDFGKKLGADLIDIVTPFQHQVKTTADIINGVQGAVGPGGGQPQGDKDSQKVIKDWMESMTEFPDQLDKVLADAAKAQEEAAKEAAKLWRENLAGQHGIQAAASANLGTTQVGAFAGLGAPAEGSTSAPSGLEAVMPGIIGTLMGFMGGLKAVMAILNPVQTILQGVFQVLAPLINTILQPLVGILILLGNTIGKVLAPIISAILVPVVMFLSTAFVYLYNYAIMPLANALIFAFNIIYDLVAMVWNAIANAINAILGWIGVHVNTMQTRGLTQGFLGQISMSDLSNAGASETGATSGASAQYSQQRPINITVTVNTDVIADTTGLGFDGLVLLINNRLRQLNVLGTT